MTDFQNFVDKERERLTKLKGEIATKQAALVDEMAGVDRELSALDAYEAAKAGKPKKSAAATTRAPRGSKRDNVLAAIKAHPNSTRGELISHLGIKGNKSEENTLGNVLGQLKKAGSVTHVGGKYAPA